MSGIGASADSSPAEFDSVTAGAAPVNYGREIVRGFIDTIPVAFGVMVYGLAYGMLARQVGLNLAEAAFMSGVVFAGASQMMAVGIWQTQLPVLALLSTTFIVNLRHIMLAASIHSALARLPRWLRYPSLFVLTDESWAMTVVHLQRGGGAAYLFGSGGAVFVFWMTATLLGGLLGNFIADPEEYGLDFAMPAVFIALLVGLWRDRRRDLLPWLVAGVIAILGAKLLPGNWYILLGGLAGFGTAAVTNAD